MTIKNIYYSIILTVLTSHFLIAQTGLRNNGNKIIVSDKAVLKVISGDFINNSESGISGKVDNEGLIMVSGDFKNNSSNNLFVNINTSGDVVLNGSSTQI